MSSTPFGPTAQRVLYWLIFVAGVAWIVVLGANSPGTPVQDEVGHYLLARSAWQYPTLILNLWGRSANTAFYMLPALGGLGVARLFSIGIAAVIVWLATKLARQVSVQSLFLIPLLLWFQPWYADFSYAVITEIPFSFLLIAGIYFATKNRLLFASALFGLLPLVRHEGIVLTGLWLLFLVYKRNWLGLVVVSTPMLVFNLIYYHIFQHWPFEIYLSPTPVDWYGAGDWLHFIGPLVSNVGVLILLLGLASIPALLRLKSKALIFIPYFIYFVVHTILYRFGLYASGGYDFFLLPLAPALAIAAALGFESILNVLSHGGIRPLSRHWSQISRVSIVGLSVVIIAVCLIKVRPRPADQEGLAAEQAANWLRAQGFANSSIVSTHVWFTYFFEGQMTPEQVRSKPPQLAAIPPGTILVWDKHYSPRWGYAYDRLSDPSSGWLILEKFNDQTFAIFRKVY